MPGRDSKGPMGEGPLTGRGLGNCKGSDKSVKDEEQLERGPGRGLGRGAGRGFGRGMGRGLGRGFRGGWGKGRSTD